MGITYSSKALLSTLSIDQGNEASGALVGAKASITSLLGNVVGLADIMMTWEQNYPQIPKPSQKSEVEALQNKSIEQCNQAIRDAAAANNAFVEFNHKATDYTQNIESTKKERWP
jgi:hypothetical protein